MKPDSSLSPALQRVHELREEGKSQRVIAEILEAEGVPLPPGRSKKWNQPGVRACLQQLEALSAPPSPTPAPSAPAPPEPPPQPPPAARLHVKIHGPWIATDYLLWEFLLQKVWADLLTNSEHTIPLTAAMRGLRLTPRRQDQEHLWDALDRLAASRVVWQGQLDEARLSIVAPLISAWVLGASLSFAFSPALVKLLHNPEQYVRLKELFGAKN